MSTMCLANMVGRWQPAEDIPDMTVSNSARDGADRIQELKSGRSWIWIWGELVMGPQNNMPDDINGINSGVICYKEAAQFSA